MKTHTHQMVTGYGCVTSKKTHLLKTVATIAVCAQPLGNCNGEYNQE